MTNGSLELDSSVLWDNLAAGIGGSGGQLSIGSRVSLHVDYSDVRGGEDDVALKHSAAVLNWGVGNIDADPVFVDASLLDYSLQLTSPCIDLGDPLFNPSLLETDAARGARLLRGRVGLGAYELRFSAGPITAR